MVRRYGFWLLVLGCTVFLCGLQGVADAGTISGGTAVTLKGLDSFANTVQSYLKGNVGKMLAMILAIGGIAMVVAGKMAFGISGLASGIGIAFVPNIIGDAFDATAAAPLGGFEPFIPWAAGGGAPDLLAQFGLVLLWPLLPLMKYGQDPVVWLALAIVTLVRPVVCAQLRRLGVRATGLAMPSRIAGCITHVG